MEFVARTNATVTLSVGELSVLIRAQEIMSELEKRFYTETIAYVTSNLGLIITEHQEKGFLEDD